jgi:phosphate-selective porin OprO/OprP
LSVSHWGRRWQVSAGVFGQESGDVDETGQAEAWALTGRATFAPVLRERAVVHLGGALSRRTPNADLPEDANRVRFRSRPETVVNQARFLNTGQIEETDHVAYYNAEAAVVYGPVSAQGEFTAVTVHRMNDLESANFRGGYAAVSWFLTGESRPYEAAAGEFGRVIPRARSGAWELTARYSTMTLNDEDVDILGGKGTNYTVGLNWHVNQNFKFMVNYVRVELDDNAAPDGGTEPFTTGDKFNIVQVRAALAL